VVKGADSGSNPQGRGFEPHSCHLINRSAKVSMICVITRAVEEKGMGGRGCLTWI